MPLTIWSRKGHLLRFQQNSTATWMEVSASMKMISGMILNQRHRKFSAKTVANMIFEQSATEKNHLLCYLKKTIYYVLDQPSIMQYGKSVLNFKFLLFTFLRSISCSIKKIKSVPNHWLQYQEFWCYWLTLMLDLSNQKINIQHSKSFADSYTDVFNSSIWAGYRHRQ